MARVRRLQSVTQNYESFYDALGGLEGIIDALEVFNGNKAKTTGSVAVVKSSIDKAFDKASERYTKILGEKIDYEALMNADRGSDSLLRHLYAGGNPTNMGEDNKRLFEVRRREVSDSKGRGFEIELYTKPDGAPSWSSITKSNRRIKPNSDGTLDYGDNYESWPERAAFVYSGRTAAGQGSSAPQGQYIAFAEGAKPRKPPKAVYSQPTFQRDYSSYKRYFDKWWKNELKVTGFEIIGAVDSSTSHAASKALRTLAKEVAATGKARGVGATGTASARKARPKANDKMAKKMGRILANEFRDALERQVEQIKPVPDKPAPAPPQSEEQIENFDDFMAGWDAIAEDREYGSDW